MKEKYLKSKCKVFSSSDAQLLGFINYSSLNFVIRTRKIIWVYNRLINDEGILSGI